MERFRRFGSGRQRLGLGPRAAVHVLELDVRPARAGATQSAGGSVMFFFTTLGTRGNSVLDGSSRCVEGFAPGGFLMSLLGIRRSIVFSSLGLTLAVFAGPTGCGDSESSGGGDGNDGGTSTGGSAGTTGGSSSGKGGAGSG